MKTQEPIIIVGGGFAGLWAALGAAHELSCGDVDRPVCLYSLDHYLTIRPRLYEANARELRVDLRHTLDPLGVMIAEDRVVGIDRAHSSIETESGKRHQFDQLVLACGSQVRNLAINGSEHLFDIDTWSGAVRLEDHLHANPAGTVVVIGAGFTGIELALELRSRLGPATDIILTDQAGVVGPELGAGPRPVIEAALAEANIEVKLGVQVDRVEEQRLYFDTGEIVETVTVVNNTGLVSSPLTALIHAPRDSLGRLLVDDNLNVVPGVFACGDVACAVTDESGHRALMSCQHAMPMGRTAGVNAARAAIGKPLEPYRQERYVTCLDLGAQGAVYSEGWDREVKMTGDDAKNLKRTINTQWIYPPAGSREEILEVVASLS